MFFFKTRVYSSTFSLKITNSPVVQTLVSRFFDLLPNTPGCWLSKHTNPLFMLNLANRVTTTGLAFCGALVEGPVGYHLTLRFAEQNHTYLDNQRLKTPHYPNYPVKQQLRKLTQRLPLHRTLRNGLRLSRLISWRFRLIRIKLPSSFKLRIFFNNKEGW